MKKNKSQIKVLLKNIYNCFETAWSASKFYTVSRIACKLFVPMFTIVNTYISKKILDILIIPDNSNLNTVLFFFVILLILMLVQFFLTKFIMYIENLHQEKISYQLLRSILEKSIDSDYSLYDNPLYYDMLNSAVNDLHAYTSVIWSLFDGISSFISCIMVFIIFTKYNVLWGILILFSSVPTAIVNYKYMKKNYDMDIKQINDRRKKDYFFTISTDKNYAQDVKLYNLKPFIVSNYAMLWAKIFNNKKNLFRNKAIITGILEIIPELSVIYITFSIIRKIINGIATIGDYSFYTELSAQFLITIFSVVNSFTTLLDNNLRVETVQRFKGIQNKIIDTGNIELGEVISICFKNVNFTYPNSSKKTLNNLCFEIHRGEHVALVGENGEGKTTIVKLLLRFYDPDSGIILINNKDIKLYSLKSLRQAFTCYFQNAKNYSFTVRENVAISDLSNANEDSLILNSLKTFGISDKLINGISGLDSYVTLQFDKNGVELSGGENQRLALARCIFKKSEVLIMDEPTSSIDAKEDTIILKKCISCYKNKIMIFTSHKLSDIYCANRIIVIKNGTVIGNSTINELIKTNNFFCELFGIKTDSN